MATPSKFVRDQVYYRAHRSSKYDRGAPVVNGRLVSLGGLSPGALRLLSNDSTVENTVVINFPSMPDSIELARKASYLVLSTYTLPDGFHNYQYTEPLRIPFSFSLHSMDQEYCPQGGLTLLDTAAKLHALTLPVAKSGSSTGAKVAGDTPGTSAEAILAASKSGNNVVNLSADDGQVSFPVAVLLDLIYAGNDAPGVSCVGYVEEVNVKLKGPWLTPPGSGNRNLPTSMDASFVMVHRPSHTNKFTVTARSVESQNVQAFADDVKNRLFNTLNLVNTASYQGFLGDR